MPIAELRCRRWRSGLGQKCVGQPLHLLPCRVDSKRRTESGMEGMPTLLARVCDRGSTTLISSMGGEKKSKCREVDVDQARVPCGKTESGGDESPVPLSKVARACPVRRRGSTQVDGWTDSLPLSLRLPRKVGCRHLKADVGNFSSYDHKFQQLSIFPPF